ncbi:MAG: tripartite tricarboxylate transporter substrate binding protein, partial [Acidovorax sp.]|nr:tripartite tricarboxylate transporter substrate binding protein [Acidovorax sp.]
MQRRTLLSALAAAGATTAAPWALAQQAAWPDQPLRWVVPYPAGGGT